jgi:hypothetical protein
MAREKLVLGGGVAAGLGRDGRHVLSPPGGIVDSFDVDVLAAHRATSRAIAPFPPECDQDRGTSEDGSGAVSYA